MGSGADADLRRRPLDEHVGHLRPAELLRRTLADIPGVHPYPSEANFLLVRFPDGKRMWNALLKRGILVRDVSAHPALADCLRITVGTPRENTMLQKAVRAILS